MVVIGRTSRLAPLIVFGLAITGTAHSSFTGWFKEMALQRLSDLIGRQVFVEGDIDVELSRTPRFRVEGIRIGNAAWSDRPVMAEIAVAEISIDLGSFFKERLELPRIALFEPRILLEVSEDGQFNWPVTQPATGSSSQQQAPASLPIVENLFVRGAQVRYIDHTHGRELVTNLGKLEGQLTVDRIRVEAEGSFNAQPFTALLESESPTDSEGDRLPLSRRVELAAALAPTEFFAARVAALCHRGAAQS